MFLRYLSCALLCAVIASVGAPSLAAPRSSGFGPAIEGSVGYDGQDKCSPAEKPGVVAFRAMVLRAYPGTGYGGISRACNVGGTSEHKEGRAWDWTVNVGVPYQRKAADSLLDWLLAEDRYGNEAAMAKRLGIMYIIWDRKIWGVWGGGWSVYCVQKKQGCKEPGKGGGLRHPHTDHVHFSFTWDGANKKTTYWRKDRSMIAGVAPSSYGYWVAGRNGSVTPVNSGYYGSQAHRAIDSPVVSMAGSPNGYGYWLASSDGKVKAYGDAPFKGSAKGETDKLSGIVPTPSGRGYWLYARGGTVWARGDADHLGGFGSTGGMLAGMAATPTGDGYWLAGTNGKVLAFGDALELGNAEGVSDVAGMVATSTGLGYWLYTKKGRVIAFGDAGFFGGLAGKKFGQKIVGLAPTASGLGYWLVGDKGAVRSFGDAPSVRVFGRTAARHTPPLGFAPSVMPED